MTTTGFRSYILGVRFKFFCDEKTEGGKRCQHLTQIEDYGTFKENLRLADVWKSIANAQKEEPKVARLFNEPNQLGPYIRYAPQPELKDVMQWAKRQNWGKEDLKAWLKEHHQRCLAWVEENIEDA